jgi:RNA polymerase sigma-70 factor (ECF subfamily)
VDDDAVVVRASLDNPAHFGVLFDRHHRTIWAFLARVAGPETADELAADVFLTAFERRHRYDPDRGQVRSWLYGIASNVLRSRQRSEGRARRAFLQAANIRAVATDQFVTVDEADELARRSQRVRAAMADLNRDQRELLALYAWEKLSYQDIADALDLPIGTVRSRLSRARARLRELLDAGPPPDRLDLTMPTEGSR